MTAATLQAATNPETGEIDMDLITTGRSAADRGRIDQITAELKTLLDSRRKDSFRSAPPAGRAQNTNSYRRRTPTCVLFKHRRTHRPLARRRPLSLSVSAPAPGAASRSATLSIVWRR
jgi:DNA replicative helicase MCM subunit Mcm2 (Cdc46/Mcm family)